MCTWQGKRGESGCSQSPDFAASPFCMCLLYVLRFFCVLVFPLCTSPPCLLLPSALIVYFHATQHAYAKCGCGTRLLVVRAFSSGWMLPAVPCWHSRSACGCRRLSGCQTGGNSCSMRQWCSLSEMQIVTLQNTSSMGFVFPGSGESVRVGRDGAWLPHM
jgi:hypothetical protein